MFVILLIYFISIVKGQFVIDTFEPTCVLQCLKNLTVISKDWEVSYNQVKIKFNLCGHLQDKYMNKYVAYIENNKNYLIGFDTFSGSLDKKLNFHPVGNTTCKLSVNLNCQMFSKEPKIQVNDKCDYQVSISSPSENCDPPPYGMMFQNVLLDFRSLQRSYNVTFDKAKNKFDACISFCNEIEDCKAGNYDCYVNGTKTEKVITVIFDRIIYNDIFYLHAYYFQHAKKKKVNVHIKCNWLKNSTDLKVLSTGKTTTFELESSLGCIKQPPVCQFTDKHFIYNLSELYKEDGYWEVQKLNSSRKIHLNVCGPLPLTEEDCSKSHSQICENDNGTYISKGRINWPSVPKVADNAVVITYIAGDIYNVNHTYVTNIEFKCSSVDGPPTIIKENGYELVIGWNTTKACPKYDPESCPEKLHGSNTYNCIHKVSRKEYYMLYNLTGLYNPNGYFLQDPKNSNYLYRLNVCGPINLREAPCKKNVMVAKVDSKEMDARKKVISYGEQTNISVRNESLIIDIAGGDNYNHNGGLTYRKANIQFECHNDVESEVVLQAETDDSLEFIWKTKHACPITVETIGSCIFDIDQYNKLDFTNITKDSILINDDGKQYLFDFCGRCKESCDPNVCTYTEASKNVVNYRNKYNLEFLLNTPCNIRQKFNQTLVELVCDKLTDNEHYNDQMRIENCTLMLQFRTDKICTGEPVIIPLLKPVENQKVQHVHYDVVPDHPVKTVALVDAAKVKSEINCTLTDPHNNYVFNINRLALNVNVTKCPANSYNFENKTITLLYNIPKSCHHSKDNLELIVELNCKDTLRKNLTDQFRCSRKMTFFLPEACKLLEVVNNSQSKRSTLSGGLITVYTLLSIFLVVLLSGLSYWIYKRVTRRQLYDQITLPYRKDADD